MEKTIKEIKKN